MMTSMKGAVTMDPNGKAAKMMPCHVLLIGAPTIESGKNADVIDISIHWIVRAA